MTREERRVRREAWATAALERLGPRPEIVVHMRSGEDDVPIGFERFVREGMFTETPGHVVVAWWRTWPLHDPGFTVA